MSDLRQTLNCASTSEVSVLCNKTKKTLANDRAAGKGPPYVKVGRTILYPIDGLREWMEANTVHPQSTPTLADAPRRSGRPRKVHQGAA